MTPWEISPDQKLPLKCCGQDHTKANPLGDASPMWEKKKWFESVHVSLTLIQGRIKDFYCGRRRMWGGKRGHQKLRKLGVQKGVEEIMSRRIQQGPLFMQVVLATSFVTEPKRAFFLLCDQYINTAKQCQTVHQFFPIEWSELIKAILY